MIISGRWWLTIWRVTQFVGRFAGPGQAQQLIGETVSVYRLCRPEPVARMVDLPGEMRCVV